MFDEFGKVIANGGSGVVIGSQSAHRLAVDELNSAERGVFYRNMLAKSPAGRGGTPDEIGELAQFLWR
ncbi:hypothetical protein, partial [Neisseria sp.]|uniref:hypothetical protein n=1 Tax=Neisseria sp. TaxID=192066 RepID=UPI0026DD333F